MGEKMKLTILFGSGADSCFNSNLKSGESFAEALLTDKYRKERKTLLGDEFANYQLVYPTSTKVFLQTVYSCQKEAEKYLNKQDIQKCVTYYENGFEKTKKDDKNESFDDIKRICKNWYNLIKNPMKQSDEKDFFLKNMVFFDSLDGKFNSLRYSKHVSNSKRVINTYAIVFILMIKSLYRIPDDFSWTYKNIFQLLRNDCDFLIGSSKKESYYDTVRECKTSPYIITTNYTQLSEKVTGKPVIYLHGKLSWFEDLRHLTVYDCLDDKEYEKAKENEKYLIPFILIPSGVKPLICKKEINQFAQFIRALDESDHLCVVGYRFNSEDNHINSIISDWLRANYARRLTYFNYENSVDLFNMAWTQDSCIKDRIVCISINENNCRKEFKKFMEQW